MPTKQPRPMTTWPLSLVATRDQLAAGLVQLDHSLAGDANLYQACDATYNLSCAAQEALRTLNLASGWDGLIPQFLHWREIFGGWRCETCYRPMPPSDSCTHAFYAIDGALYRRVPYGSEPGWPYGDASWQQASNGCPWCGVRHGGYHHAWCTDEVCPCCDETLMFCPHFQEEGYHSGTILRRAIAEARALLRAGQAPVAAVSGGQGQ